MIYFDSAATTLQKPETVPAAVAEAIRTMTTPGRGDYPAAHLGGGQDAGPPHGGGGVLRRV